MKKFLFIFALCLLIAFSGKSLTVGYEIKVGDFHSSGVLQLPKEGTNKISRHETVEPEYKVTP